MINKLLLSILAIFNSIFSFLIGNITWSSPPWIRFLAKKAQLNPKTFWMSIFLFLLLAIGFSFGYHWYASLPQPERILTQIVPPKITPIDKILLPDHLNIHFGILSNGKFVKRSVAPLNNIGKEVTKGITITPYIPGHWKWESDSHLMFTPIRDWPASQPYDIQFSKDFFTHGIKMKSSYASFTTLPFKAKISDFKFYQSPLDPKLKQAIATLSFNYPVDPTALEKKISLIWQKLSNDKQDYSAPPIKFNLVFDEHKRTAYLTSESLLLPETEKFLELILAKGILPIEGSTETANEIRADILIPDAKSYFKINQLTTTIIRNQKDQPEQVLTLDTNLGLTDSELNKSFHAYILPSDYPATSYSEVKPNYAWQNPGEVTPAILSLAQPINLQPIPVDHKYASLHHYKYHAPSSSYIYVKLDKGTRGFGNFTLANDYRAILKVPEYPKEITLLHKGALLALGTEEKLSILVRGLTAVKFSLARIMPNDLNHLITQTGGDFSHPYFINPIFNQDNISEVFSQIRYFDTRDPAQEQYTAFDLSQYLVSGHQNKRWGLFILQANGWDPVKKTPLNIQTNRLILITDLGLIIKDNTDETHDIFVQSINQGTPVLNASVSVLGKNGIPLITRNTDREGHAVFPSLKDFINEQQPTVYLVRHGEDISFIPYRRYERQLNYSRFDVGGITNQAATQAALTAYLFSDRGIYRPGDQIHIGMIIKQPYVVSQPQGLPLKLTITDPRGLTVKDEKITLNDIGYLTFDFQTQETSPTGRYFVNLYIAKDHHPNDLIGSTSIQISEFLPDKLRITAQLSQIQKRGWISPNGLFAKIGLQNLYGTPAVNQRITGKLILTPQAVTFKEFPNYIFVDPLIDPKSPPKTYTEILNETHTAENGQAELALKLERFDKATYQLTVFVEGFESAGGRSITTETSALISPLTYLVGYKSDGDLQFIKQNTSRSVHIIAINPQLNQQPLNHLSLELYRLHPVTTLVKKEDNTYQYQSIMQSTLLNNNTFDIPNQGKDLTLKTDQIGDFLVKILDKDNTELSQFKYSVVGNSQQPLPKNAELSVKLNKSIFQPGEDIEMQITAPYTGAGLITIERDKVYNFSWFKTTTTASVQKIHIPNDFQGDGYINIAFVRDLNSAEIFMSPLSYHVIPFSVTHKNHDIHIDLSVPSLIHSGNTLPITYKTDKPSKIILFVVDEGILQVTQYISPNPIAFFFRKHALEVDTLQIVDEILPKFIANRELSAVGGDTGEIALKKNLNPFKRKTEAPVVYWSGILDADNTPRQLIYSVPDYFNGSLRIMAVAVASDAVGAATQNTESRGYFVINPNTPTFVAPGDEFDITTTIANNIKDSGKNANIAVELTTSPGLRITSPSKQNIIIPEGEERNIQLKVKASSLLGSASLQWTARLNDQSSKQSSTLSIRPATAYTTSIISGYTKDTKKMIELDRRLYPEYRNVEAVVSSNPLILVHGLQNYLNNYPYGCTEQLISKGFPLLVMSTQATFNPDYQLIANKIQQIIDMLSQRQMSSGGFSYWPEVASLPNNDFVSVYAMHFLTEAKMKGYSIPNDIFSAGMGFLKDLARREISTLEQARIQAYAIYILSRNEIVTTNYLIQLQLTLNKMKDSKWQQDITSAYLAATYQLLKSYNEAEKMIGYYSPQSQVNKPTDFYNIQIANAQYLYLLGHHFPVRLGKAQLPLILTLVDELNNNTMNTVLAGYTSLALAAYNQFSSFPSHAMLSIYQILNGNKPTILTSTNGLYQKVNANLAARQIVFNNPSNQMYFYQLTQAGFDAIPPKQVSHQGIEVYREFLTTDGRPISSIHLGDELIVHIRARAIDNRDHDNVALLDLLPGGFEVVRHSINLQNMDYVDIREDRVVFFGNLNPDSKEITYRIKATNIGKFTVPGILAMDMYNPLVKSLGIAGSIDVK